MQSISTVNIFGVGNLVETGSCAYHGRYGIAASVDSARNLPNDGMLCYPTMMMVTPGPNPEADPVVDHAHGCRLAWSSETNKVQVGGLLRPPSD